MQFHARLVRNWCGNYESITFGNWFITKNQKADGVTYGKLDKAERITNILLLLFYVGFSFFYLFLGTNANPHYNGFLGILGWFDSVIMASAALFCGVDFGLSVVFRKRGSSKLSFAVQF